MKNFKIKYPSLQIGGPVIDVTMKMSAKFRLVKRKQISETECIETEISEFTNLITDNGLDIVVSTSSCYYYCQVGTGTATPAFSDVALGNKVAHTGCINVTSPTPTTAPYTRVKTFKYTFKPGELTVPITEIGISPVITDNLFSRTLIKDTNGKPASVSLLSDEYLDVYYSISITPPAGDRALVFTINGTQYNATLRGLGYLNTGTWMWHALLNVSYNNSLGYYGMLYTGSLPVSASTSIRGSGDYLGMSSRSTLTYVNGQRKLQRTFTFAPELGALSIKSIVIEGATRGPVFGLEFATAIPKSDTQTFTFTFQISWDRA